MGVTACAFGPARILGLTAFPHSAMPFGSAMTSAILAWTADTGGKANVAVCLLPVTEVCFERESQLEQMIDEEVACEL
jgi:hypothetical protein